MIIYFIYSSVYVNPKDYEGKLEEEEREWKGDDMRRKKQVKSDR